VLSRSKDEREREREREREGEREKKRKRYFEEFNNKYIEILNLLITW
jgi:hypothetical protein